MAVTIDGVGEINGVVLPTTSFGKVLQVVRATDSTSRTTTSTTFVDANISVTITPQKNNSAILIFWAASFFSNANDFVRSQITDNSNNAISGAQDVTTGGNSGTSGAYQTVIAYSTPATTSATTYKGRFRSESGATVEIFNNRSTGQMYAIEVSA